MIQYSLQLRVYQILRYSPETQVTVLCTLDSEGLIEGNDEDGCEDEHMPHDEPDQCHIWFRDIM